MKLAVILVLALVLLFLVRRNLLQVDLSFPLFVGLVILGFASMNEAFIEWTAASLGIVYPPIAIIFIAIAILLALITILAIAYSRLRSRQQLLVRQLARMELERQEMARQTSVHE
jgi:predicted membrane protein